MNILQVIQDAITAINANANVYLYEKSRDENESLNYTTPVIIIFPDWTTSNNFSQGNEILKQRIYNIDFKTQDEFDNSDADITKSYNDITSVDRIEAMEVLCNSLLYWIQANQDTYNIEGRLIWTTPRPILRENSGTMSGIRIRLTINFKGEKICDYDEVTPPTELLPLVYSAITYNYLTSTSLQAFQSVTNPNTEAVNVTIFFSINGGGFVYLNQIIDAGQTYQFSNIFTDVNSDIINVLRAFNSNFEQTATLNTVALAPFSFQFNSEVADQEFIIDVGTDQLLNEFNINAINDDGITEETFTITDLIQTIEKIYSTTGLKEVNFENNLNCTHLDTNSKNIECSGDEISKLLNLYYISIKNASNFVINENEIELLAKLRNLELEAIDATISAGELSKLINLRWNDTLSLKSLSRVFIDDNEIFRTFSLTINDCSLTSNEIDIIIIRFNELISKYINGTNVVNNNLENGVLTRAYTTFVGDGKTGFSAISNGSSVHAAGTDNEIDILVDETYLVTFNLILNSGVLPGLVFQKNLGDLVYSNVEDSVEGSNSFIFTITTSQNNAVFSFFNINTTTNYVISNLKIIRISSENILDLAGVSNGVRTSASDAAYNNLLDKGFVLILN